MKKYISPSINPNYFRECILDYLTEVHHYPKSELTFWTFVDSLTFENGMISRECIVFKELKDYSDKHPVTKIAVLWSLYGYGKRQRLYQSARFYQGGTGRSDGGISEISRKNGKCQHSRE